MPKHDGKRAEKKFTAGAKELMRDPQWWVHRFPDAAVCRGRIPKQPADYLVMYKGVAYLVEVKESKHSDKIETARLTQRPKMNRFIMAGGGACFVVYHYNEDLWRVVPTKALLHVETSSVDIKAYPTYKNIKEIFDVIRYCS